MRINQGRECVSRIFTGLEPAIRAPCPIAATLRRDRRGHSSVNAARANGGRGGGNSGRLGSPCRIAASGHVATPRPTAPVNATRASDGTHGQPLPDRGRAATLTGGASGHNARETRHGGTAGRGAGTDSSRSLWPAPTESRPAAHVATPGPPGTKSRLPPVNAIRANVGRRGRERRHLPDRGG